MFLRVVALIWLAVSGVVWAASAGIAAAQTRPEDELPDGPGKKILQASCTSCHELDEVTKFKDYWDRKQWQDAVGTMIAYGAEIDENEAKVLTDYLVQHLGRKEEK